MALTISHLSPTPIHELLYLSAAQGGGVETEQLPFLTGNIDGLPEELDGLLITSDLQGIVPAWARGGASQLLGESVAEVYLELEDQGLVPSAERVGVILSGDFYSAPEANKRGASGDMRSVWEAFATYFKWVVGVAGNHDQFGTEQEQEQFFQQERMYLLDGDTLEIDGLRLSGVSWIIGKTSKGGRVSQEDFLEKLDACLKAKPDLLILHEGPSGFEGQMGNPKIRKRIMEQEQGLTCCGHVHWKEPLAELAEGVQVLNADAWAVVLGK